mmetsp:Transcript_21346/g.25716  ORF Transcript_21346/g.25716 Transcript_21346/m.25716 type:complete len:103 (-) Transcript_21346:42-350(-)
MHITLRFLLTTANDSLERIYAFLISSHLISFILVRVRNPRDYNQVQFRYATLLKPAYVIDLHPFVPSPTSKPGSSRPPMDGLFAFKVQTLPTGIHLLPVSRR